MLWNRHGPSSKKKTFAQGFTVIAATFRSLYGLAFILLAVSILQTGCSTLGHGQAPQNTLKLSDPLQQQYHSALKLMAAEKYLDAIPMLKAVAAARPDLASPYVNLGISYRNIGRLDDAMSSFEEAISRRPELAAAHNLIGILKRQAGDFEGARKAYEASIDAQSDYANAELNLGILHDIYLRNPQEALVHYQRYAKLTDAQDETVAQWVTDLQQRIKNQSAKADEVATP